MVLAALVGWPALGQALDSIAWVATGAIVAFDVVPVITEHDLSRLDSKPTDAGRWSRGP